VTVVRGADNPGVPDLQELSGMRKFKLRPCDHTDGIFSLPACIQGQAGTVPSLSWEVYAIYAP